MRLTPCVRRSVARTIPSAPLRSAGTVAAIAHTAPRAARTSIPQFAKAFAAPVSLVVGPQDQALTSRSTRQGKLFEKASRSSSRNPITKEVAKYALHVILQHAEEQQRNSQRDEPRSSRRSGGSAGADFASARIRRRWYVRSACPLILPLRFSLLSP